MKVLAAGIVGSVSIAYHFTAAAGCGSVVMLERERAVRAKVSTGKSMGGVRAQFSTPVSIQMSLYSIPFFRDFLRACLDTPPVTAIKAIYSSHRGSVAHLNYLRANLERQVAAGVSLPHRAAFVDHKISCGCMFLAVAFRRHPRRDFFAPPTASSTRIAWDDRVHSARYRIKARAWSRGARDWSILEPKDARGITAVETTNGAVTTRTVVNACGAWAAHTARMAELDLPVEPLRRMLVPTEPFDKIAHSAPMTVDMSTGFHFRPGRPGIIDGLERSRRKARVQPRISKTGRSWRKFLRRAPLNCAPVLEEVEVNPSARLGRAVRDDARSSSHPG